MLQQFGIAMDATAVFFFLRVMRLAAANNIREEFLAEIHDNGGIMSAIDVIRAFARKKTAFWLLMIRGAPSRWVDFGSRIINNPLMKGFFNVLKNRSRQKSENQS